MGLEIILDSLDGLPDEIKEHYKPGTGDLDGQFVLEAIPVNGVDLSLEPVNGLKTALAKTREELKEAKASAGKLVIEGKDYSSTDIVKLIQDLEEATQAASTGDIDALKKSLAEQYEAKSKGLTTKYQTELEQLKSQNSNLAGRWREAELSRALNEAIATHKANGQLLGPSVRNRLRVDDSDGTPKVVVLSEDGQTPLIGSGTESMTVTEFVGGLKNDPVYSVCFPGSGASGSGSQNAGGGVGGGDQTEAQIRAIKNKAERLSRAREQGLI